MGEGDFGIRVIILEGLGAISKETIANLSWECKIGSKSLNIHLLFVVSIELNPRNKE